MLDAIVTILLVIVTCLCWVVALLCLGFYVVGGDMHDGMPHNRMPDRE